MATEYIKTIECPKCRYRNVAGTKFCVDCGAPQLGSPVPCGKCGTMNPPGTKFCGNCGNNLLNPVENDPDLRFLEDALRGKYILQKALGEGGFGRVFLAEHTGLKQKYVVKLLSIDSSQSEDIRKLFFQEAQLIARLKHPNIVDIMDVAEYNGRPYYIMSYLSGGSLKTLLQREKKLSIEQALEILIKLLNALAEVHSKGIIHRDIKPSNVIFDELGEPTLIDFGIAILDEGGKAKTDIGSPGTPTYMSPEQLNERSVDKTTDIYSMGIMLFELITGKPPYEGNKDSLTIQHSSVIFPSLLDYINKSKLTEGVQSLLQKACAKEPSSRYASAKDMRNEAMELIHAGPKSSLEREEAIATQKKEMDEVKKKVELEAKEAIEKAERERKEAEGLLVAHLNFEREKAERLRLEAAKNQAQIKQEIDKVGDSETFTNSIGMEFILIPSGEFMMGAVPQDKDAEDNEKPQHKVRISKPFYIGKYPVIQEEWQKVMGNNPSVFKDAGNRAPVENISINDIQKFLLKLNDIDGKLYRLPTEAEWEYAARGGSNSIFSFGDDGISKMFKSKIDDYAWYDKISENTTHPVGEKKPNDFQLYDMVGNVLEWCEDSSYSYSSSESIDPIETYSSYRPKILRGSSFSHNAKACRVSKRFEEYSDKKNNNIGFRLILVLNPSREQIEQMKLLFLEQERLENRKKEIELQEQKATDQAKWGNKNNKNSESRHKKENIPKPAKERTGSNGQASGKNPPEIGLISKAKIIKVYNLRDIGLIAGCSVLFGSGTVNSKVKLVRRNSVYWEGRMESIQLFRQNVTSFKKGDECGIRFKNSPDFQEGDIIEFWEAESTLDRNETITITSKHNKTYTNSLGMEFVLVEAGEFMMGAVPQDKDAEDNEKPQHKVRITKPFYIGKYPVVYEEYIKMKNFFIQMLQPLFSVPTIQDALDINYQERAPVNLSWDECHEFIQKLSEKEGMSYRLPSEAEWEYAARGGSRSSYIYTYGDDTSILGNYAWYKENLGESKFTQIVGQKKPNSLGIYDMMGNVSEWCIDYYKEDYYKNSPESDPRGPKSGRPHVCRGGSIADIASSCRLSSRKEKGTDPRWFRAGCRLVFIP